MDGCFDGSGPGNLPSVWIKATDNRLMNKERRSSMEEIHEVKNDLSLVWQLFSIMVFCSSKKKKNGKYICQRENCFLFFVLIKGKHDIFIKPFSIVFTCFLKVVLKNNYTNMKND